MLCQRLKILLGMASAREGQNSGESDLQKVALCCLWSRGLLNLSGGCGVTAMPLRGDMTLASAALVVEAQLQAL